MKPQPCSSISQGQAHTREDSCPKPTNFLFRPKLQQVLAVGLPPRVSLVGVMSWE